MRDTTDRSSEAPGTASTARGTIDGRTAESPSGSRWLAFACAGAAALVAAVAVVLFPSLVPSPAGPGGTELLRSLALVLAGVTGLLALYELSSRSDAGPEAGDPTELPSAEPTEPADVEQWVVGEEFDRYLSTIDGRVDHYDGLQASYAEDVRRRLRTTVVEILVRRTGCSREEALGAIRDGTWTDDRRAGSFLGGEQAAEPPLDVQLRDWASGEAFDRKVAATLGEIRRIDGGERP